MKKRLIMVGSVPPPYHGSNVYFQGLLDSEIMAKYDVVHVDLSDHRGLENMSRLDLTNVSTALKGIRELRKRAEEFKPHIVYIPVASNFLPFLRDGLLILTASKYSEASIVIHLHEGNYFREKFYNRSNVLVRKFISKALSKVTTAIVYTKQMEPNFSGLVSRVTSFLNGKDVEVPEKFVREFRNDVRISYIGNFFESKGIVNFLRAAAVIAKEDPDIKFTAAGAWGADGDKVRRLIDEIMDKYELRDRIDFPGPLTGEELKKFYMSTDILIFPTIYPYEGCPLVLIDALGFGIPIITSQGIGAIPEMITDGLNGMLVNPHDHEEIAGCAYKLAKDSGMRKHLSHNARRTYQEKFTKEVNVTNLISVFENSVENNDR